MRGVRFLRVVGRLKPGVTADQARSALQTLQNSYKQARPEAADNSWSPVVISAAQDATGDLRQPFFVLLGAVGFVLLIACSNVANLLLVMFTGRRREIALRMALGARPEQVRRQFLSLALRALVAGTGLGLVGAGLTGHAMQAVLFQVPALHPPTLVLTFVILASVSLVACLLPSRRAARISPMEALAEE